MSHRSVLRGTAAMLCLLTGVGARAIDLPPPAEVDISGFWRTEGTASFQDEDKGAIDCSYEGSVTFEQTGSELSGQAVIGLVTGDPSCPGLGGPVSGTVSGNRADFAIGADTKGVGAEFCGTVFGEVITGDWVAPPPLPCFFIMEQKGGQFIGSFTGERVPPGAPTLSLPGLGALVLVLALLGGYFVRRRSGL